MKTEEFVARSRIDLPAQAVYDWHAREGAFERLAPPWETIRVVESGDGVVDGSRAVIEVRVGPFKSRWVALHENVDPPNGFVDVQERGPFAHWRHQHCLDSAGDSSCILEDRIELALPLGALGRAFGLASVRRKLDRVFRFRHARTIADLEAHHSFHHSESRPLKIAITGASGLVGTSIASFLSTGGHEVWSLVRRDANREAREIAWDPQSAKLDPADLDGLDAVVHLAGENIASGRWTAKRKRRIRDSRVNGTALLSKALAECEAPPKTLVSASATGFYGDRGDEVVDESSSAGEGFLTDVCREWEDAAAPARERGIRVVQPRIGVVLSPQGGALKKMLLPFRLGAGGRIGSGRQHMSWIALDDLVYAIHHMIQDESLEGPVNAVTPNPVTNAEFTKTLGRVLRRPTIFPMPAFAAKLAFGELAEALLLSGHRVQPTRLTNAGFAFRFPDLEGALRHLLGR